MSRKSRRSRQLAVTKGKRASEEQAETRPPETQPGLSFAERWGAQFVAVVGVGMAVLLLLSPLLLHREYPLTQEEYRYAELLLHFRVAQSDGQLYPRWLPDLAGGYGYPTFVFYQPLFFFVASLFGWLPYGPALAPLLAVVLFAVVGGWGAYRVGRHFGDLRWGIFSAVMFLMTPYLFSNFYVRGDLSELAAMLLTPWAIHFLLLLAENVNRSRRALPAAAGLAVSLSCVVLAHPATALLFWPLVAILAGCEIFRSQARWHLLGWTTGAVLGGLALSAPYWMPVFTMRPHVNLDNATVGYFVASRHTVWPHQWLLRTWQFGTSIPDSPADGMSFQLGLPHLLLAAAGIWFGRKNFFVRSAGILYGVLLLAMTPLAGLLWDSIGLLRLVQFPWRILSVLAIVQVVCMGGLSERFVTYTDTRTRTLLGVVAICFSLVWYSNMFEMRVHEEQLRTMDIVSINVTAHYAVSTQQMVTHAGMNEFCPNTANMDAVKPRGKQPLLLVPEKSQWEQMPDHSRHALHYRVRLAEPDKVVLNQFYFPGWKVLVDGQPIPDPQLRENLLPDGRMQIPLPGGRDIELRAGYAGPPGGRLRWGIAVVVPLLALLLGWWTDRAVGGISTSNQPA